MPKILQHVAVLALLSLVYYLLKRPTASLTLAYYDEGEFLYHVLSFLKGGVPYRDDVSHHFLGYIVPYVILSKFVGFSIYLVGQLAFVTQILTGFLVYLCARFLVPLAASVLAALLTISAREPWVLGFFQPHQTNMMVLAVAYLCFSYIKNGKDILLAAAGFLSGLTFVFDQRLILALALPFVALLLASMKNTKKLKKSLPILFATSLVPAICLIYLYKNDALLEFYRQCFVFPLQYRVGGKSFSEVSIHLHKFLFTDTPILFVSTIFAFLYVCFNFKDSPLKKYYIFLLAFGLVQMSQPLFGGRLLDYYTIPWLPWMALISVVGLKYFEDRYALLSRGYHFFLVAPVLIALVSSLTADAPKGYKGDGVQETVQFLKDNMAETDSFYVWGYRLDLYARLERLSAYRFANTMFFHPDGQIISEEERLKHIYPIYQEEFMRLIEERPAKFVVVAVRDNFVLNSPAQTALFDKLSKNYQVVFEIRKKDFLHKECHFKVHKLNV